MVIGAHPDDADLCAGGTVLQYVAAGACVRLVSFLNGDKGKHVRFAEAFELSEYGHLPTAEELSALFPFLPTPAVK